MIPTYLLSIALVLAASLTSFCAGWLFRGDHEAKHRARRDNAIACAVAQYAQTCEVLADFLHRLHVMSELRDFERIFGSVDLMATDAWRLEERRRVTRVRIENLTAPAGRGA